MKEKKKFFFVILVLFITGCDFFQTSLADYLRGSPAGLRLVSLWAIHNGQTFYPLEALEPGRDLFTIVVTPAATPGIAIALNAVVEDASSTVIVPLPWNCAGRPAPNVEGIQNYWKYRDDEERHINVTATNGVSKTYTVTIIWAELINDPSEITGFSQDYYLKPGPPIELAPDWLPIGAAADYASYTAFSGGLRGNGRTIRIRGFKSPPSGRAENQGLFGKIERAWIEDLDIQLVGTVRTAAEHSGGLAGTARESVIQRVKVSGGIFNDIASGSTANVGGITGTLEQKALIYNCVSKANVSGSFSGGGYSNFYMGGVTGNEEYTSGGYVFNAFAGGTVNAFTPATVGGITGGGGSNTNTDIRGCIAVNPRLNALPSGKVDYILGQWDGPTVSAHNSGNYYYDQYNDRIIIIGTSATPWHITGTPRTGAALRQQSTYAGLGWDFNSVWKMGSGGYPALIWE